MGLSRNSVLFPVVWLSADPGLGSLLWILYCTRGGINGQTSDASVSDWIVLQPIRATIRVT